eukprot:3554542-Alexandrium_andersonii.AAC.1
MCIRDSCPRRLCPGRVGGIACGHARQTHNASPRDVAAQFGASGQPVFRRSARRHRVFRHRLGDWLGRQ